MEKNNSQSSVQTKTSTLAQIDWLKLATNLFFGVARPFYEIAYGIKTKRIPIGECILWADTVGLLILFRCDLFIFEKLGIVRWYPSHLKSYGIYCSVFMGSGFWLWGLFQTFLRTKLIGRLSHIFIESGLKSPTGKLPAFIFDYPVDEFTRKMRLGRSCFSKDQFEKAKPSLESSLQVYIDEMRENREKGTLDIIYSHWPMLTLTKIEKIQDLRPLTFVIGKTRAKQITASLQKVPHLLVAGQTGGGKSTFLRGVITSLFLNNTNFDFTLIDLKGGLEFQIFENLKRVKVIPSVAQAVSNLHFLESTLNERMALLKANECKDIDVFLALPSEKRREANGVCFSGNLSRHVIVVDEAAEMFLAGAHANTGEIQTARKILSQIARQGRSVGVHLIIATQRPDAKSLDTQVKANLTGILCFQMPNDASSITVLGVGRATDIPAISGRAIWKCGAEMIEVQTPLLDTEETEQLLEPHRVKTQSEPVRSS